MACKSYTESDLIRTIFEVSVSEAIRSIYAVLSRMKMKNIGVYYTGGLFQCPSYENLFRMRSRNMHINIRGEVEYPVSGAILIGLKDLGLDFSWSDVKEGIVNFIHQKKNMDDDE